MTKEQDPVLSIVIVSYNVKDFLLDCLHSIHEFIKVGTEIIVVDNASADGTCALVKEKFPGVVLVESKTNLGFSAANNKGFELTKGKYILMLNPDACLIDNSFEQALSYLQQTPGKPVLLGPRIYNPDRSFQPSAWKFPNIGQHFLECIFLNKLIDTTLYPEESSATEPFPVDFVSGAAILMSKETLQKIGNLDEKLFWMDDTDLCYRNKLLKGENLYFPEWQIIHHIGQSSKKNLSLVIANQLISKLKFYRKYKRHFSFAASALIFFKHIVIRLILLLPASLFSKNAFLKWKAYAFALKKYFGYLFSNEHQVA